MKIGSRRNEPKRGRFFGSKYIESDRENSEHDVSKSHTHVEISYNFSAAKSKSPVQTIPKLVKWSVFTTKHDFHHLCLPFLPAPPTSSASACLSVCFFLVASVPSVPASLYLWLAFATIPFLSLHALKLSKSSVIFTVMLTFSLGILSFSGYHCRGCLLAAGVWGGFVGRRTDHVP